ncbi:MAG: sulfurtransferase [Anaerolineaceae bacterium]|jgi:thiosulfate/3-mercaptopyruvate sulfurtransferase
MYTHFITPHQLAEHYQDADWAIVDCRHDLTNPNWGFQDYQRAHIPGAVFAHLDHDLAGPITATTGRHPLPSPDMFKQKLEEWGIDPETQVIAYDTTGGGFAARLWWMLRLIDHYRVALLDGGLAAWQAAGYATKSGIEHRIPTHWQSPLAFNPAMMVEAHEVERIRQHPAFRLIDARAPERYSGEVEFIDPVAGHIPGAVNRFHGQNLQPDGALKPLETLRQEFLDLLDGVQPQNAVLYCGSGVTSCHHLIAMEAVGLFGARIYAGSWSEWIRDPKRPQVKGKSSTTSSD